MANVSDFTIGDIGLESSKYTSLKYMNYAINTTFNYSDNSIFYSLVNPTYYDYYWRVVRYNLEWYDGYVIGLHSAQNGIISTRIASALVRGITNNILKSKLLFKKANSLDPNTALEFISNKWAKKTNFNNIVRLATEYSCASGTSLLKLNQAYKDLWVQALRQDQFYYSTDFQNNITDITCYIKAYVNINRETDNSKQDNYFIVEHRCYKKLMIKSPITMLDGTTKVYEKLSDRELPCVEYQIHRYTGQMFVNQSMASAKIQRGLNWNDIPKAVREIIRKDYTAIRFNEPLQLPFNDLGCELVMVNGQDGTVPNGMFGVSLLTDIRSCLIEYELINAYSLRDMFNAQGRVGVPKALTISDTDTSQGVGVYDITQNNYETYVGNPDSQKPIITQFELRASEWEIKKDDCLKKIASIIGMSPKMISSDLGTPSQFGKTATATESEDKSVNSFIEVKQNNLREPINKILTDALRFYGYSTNVEVKFSLGDTSDKSQLLRDIDFKYSKGYIDLREALKELNVDADESQLDDLEQKALLRQQEIKSDNANGVSSLGDFLPQD